MNIDILRTELTTDPLGRGYAGMSDAEAADDLNTVYRTVPRDTVESHVVMRRFDLAEFNTNVAAGNKTAQRELLTLVLSQGLIDPADPLVEEIVKGIFGAGSETVKNLVGAAGTPWEGDDIRVRLVSRAEELGLGHVKVGHVQQARS